MVFLCLAPYVQTGVGVRFGSDKKPEILDANHDITHWLTLFVDDFAHGMHAAVQGDGTHVCHLVWQQVAPATGTRPTP
tara:strand:- start:3732 stop:3965 length:234 start_codon:yes stop_codon:yes gene_type:complete